MRLLFPFVLLLAADMASEKASALLLVTFLPVTSTYLPFPYLSASPLTNRRVFSPGFILSWRASLSS